MSKRNGKIARLPKDLRELVNRMIDDGAQYTSIMNELDKHRHRWPDDIANITDGNLSEWHHGGYQDWVRERELREDLQARNDFALNVAESTPEAKLNEVVLQIGVNHLYHVLASFNRADFEPKYVQDPATFCRMVNTLARLSRGALDMQKYKDHVRERKQRIEAELDKASHPGGLTPEALAVIQKELKLL